jgi:sugar O-acyltransferase (sialic acid O-acetyltransferase NeuD family)
MPGLLILGAGGHGKVVAEAAAALGRWSALAFVDDRFPALDVVNGVAVRGRLADAPALRGEFPDAVVAIGHCRTRLRVLDDLARWGFARPTIVHPAAWVSPSASLGAGAVVFAQAAVNACARLGDGCIVNTGASVDHDARLGDGVHVCPGARVAGEVVVGDASWLGIGCSVIQRVRVGADVTVGAGAAVVRDLPDGVTALGVPARVTKRG